MTTIASEPSRRLAPILRGNFLLGCSRELLRDPLKVYLEATRRFGDVVRIRITSSLSMFVVTHPHDVEHILQKDQKHYGRNVRLNKSVGLVLGEGLLTSVDEVWLRQRRLMQPAFQPRRIASLGAIMTDEARVMVERWGKIARRGQPLDVLPEMIHLTLEVVCRSLFGTDIGDKTETIGRSMKEAIAYIIYRARHPMALPESLPTPRNRRFREAMRTLDRIVFGIIESRRHADVGVDDLLSMLLQARDEQSGGEMDDRQIRDEVITFLLAGHETTAIALTWTWYLLTQHPDVEERLHAELDRVLGGRWPTAEDLPRLAYTRRVFEEALRLYPPAWNQSRIALADDEVGGYHLPAGSLVSLCQYVTHRHPDFWEEPERFDPERFTPEHSAGRPRFAYFPFGGGARQCIGNHFAMMEGQLILASVAQRYRMRLVPGHPIEPDATFTFRPRPGVLVTLQETTASQ